MADPSEALVKVRQLFYEKFFIPESLQAPLKRDSPEFLAYVLFVRALASVLYVREVLDVFAVVAKTVPHGSTSVLYARALAELAALNYYLRKNIRDTFRASKLDIALEWAHKGFSGNRYLKSFMTPDSPEFDGLPKPVGLTFDDPLDVAKATKCYSTEVLHEEAVRQDYEYLSELSHPNAAAINHHLHFVLEDRRIHFSRTPTEEDKWDGYMLKYATRVGVEIIELISLAKEIDPKLNETTTAQ